MNEQRLAEAVFRVESMSSDIAEIKVSMKEMASAVNRLAVIEERQSRDRADIGRAFSLLDEHGGRIGELEKAQPLQTQTSKWVDRAIWMVVSAVIAAVIGLVVVNRVPGEAHPKEPPVLGVAK